MLSQMPLPPSGNVNDAYFKEEAGGDPMGRSGGVKGDLFLWHYILLTRYHDGATITIFTL